MQFDIIYTGDCLNLLKTLHDDSVHCCVTSPSVLRPPRYRPVSAQWHHSMKDKITLFS